MKHFAKFQHQHKYTMKMNKFKAKPIPGIRRTTLLAFAAIGMSWCVASRTASAATVDINGGTS